MKSITIDELLSLSDPYIVDVRSYREYQQGHIPGAVFMDYSNLELYPHRYLDKNSVYYFYCASGMRSSHLVNILNKKGYQVVNVSGGYYRYLLRK